MKKAVALVLTVLLLAAAVIPLAAAANIDSITIVLPRVDNVQMTLTNALDKYAQGNFGFGDGFVIYLDEGGTVTFPQDMTLTNFAAGTTITVPKDTPVSIDEVAGAGMYSTDGSAYFTIDTPKSPYFSPDILNADLRSLEAGAASSGAAPAPAAQGPTPVQGPLAEPATEGPLVYMTVSVEGVLQIAAAPVHAPGGTIESALIEAHRLFCPQGEAGFGAGIDATYGMYLINKFWGVSITPYVLYNGKPLGADPAGPMTADTAQVVDGDNIVVNVSPSGRMPVAALTYDEDLGHLVATVWALDFTTFTYNSSVLGNVDIIDAKTGEVVASTDGTGRAQRFKEPESGVVAITGLAALPLRSDIEYFVPFGGVFVPPEHDYSLFGGPDGRQLLWIVIFGCILIIPLFICVITTNAKEAKSGGVKYAGMGQVRLDLFVGRKKKK